MKYSKSFVDIRTQFQTLKVRILNFWHSHFSHLSEFIFRNEKINDEYNSFFCDPAKAVSMSYECNNTELSINDFKDYFTSHPGYWFHFKSITMPRIEKDCILYYRQKNIPFTKTVWAQWYAYLCICIKELGSPDPPAAPMASRYLPPARGKSLHLTARVLRSLVPEGGRRWCVRVVG